jgi:hypothetical protein
MFWNKSGTLNGKREKERVLRAMLLSPVKKQLIIKYLTTEIDYNRYVALGKANRIPKPEVCPHCGLKGCLIGHGWYKKKDFRVTRTVFWSS